MSLAAKEVLLPGKELLTAESYTAHRHQFPTHGSIRSISLKAGSPAVEQDGVAEQKKEDYYYYYFFYHYYYYYYYYYYWCCYYYTGSGRADAYTEEGWIQESSTA